MSPHRPHISGAPLTSDWFRGKRVTVMGLGRFGGGVGVARFLVNAGADVLVTDLADAESLAESMNALTDLPVQYRLGEHVREDFERADMIVANPAVKPSSEFLAFASAAGVPVETEMSLFMLLCPASVIGVTGTSGKSTTTAMLGAILERTGQTTWVGGNIGRSLLSDLDHIEPSHNVVVELSSFQLHYLDRHHLSPRIAVVTNFWPNHLDWHGGVEAYERDKAAIVRHQSEADYAVLNAEDEVLARWAGLGRASNRYFGGDGRGADAVFERDGLFHLRRRGHVVSTWPCALVHLPGRHNVLNAMAAIGAAACMGADESSVAAGLESFDGLPHRLGFVGQWHDVQYYNDSKATTPEAAIMALRSFSENVTIIAGGYDKGADMGAFAAECAACARNVILIGVTADAIARGIERARAGPEPYVTRAATFAEAVRKAVEVSSPGDVVLLSPACASWDMFENYEQRGEQFKQWVKQFAP